MQQLKENDPQEEKENQVPHIKITKTEYIDFATTTDESLNKNTFFFKNKSFHYLLGTYPWVISEVFHPPRV